MYNKSTLNTLIKETECPKTIMNKIGIQKNMPLTKLHVIGLFNPTVAVKSINWITQKNVK